MVIVTFVTGRSPQCREPFHTTLWLTVPWAGQMTVFGIGPVALFLFLLNPKVSFSVAVANSLLVTGRNPRCNDCYEKGEKGDFRSP